VPITVQYQPDAAVIADAAMTAGLGQFRERQAARNLQIAEMVQRDLAQQRAIAADQQRQAAQQQFAAMQAGADRAMRVGAMQFDAALGERDALRRRGWAVDDRDVARFDDHFDREADRGFRREMFDAGVAADWERTAAMGAGREVSTVMADIGKNTKDLTPEGQMLYGKLAGTWRAIQAARPGMKPAEYAAQVQKFSQELRESGIEGHISKPPPLEEQFASEVVEIAGKGMFSKDRSGAWRQIDKPPAQNKVLNPATFEQRYQDFDTFQKDFDTEFKRLQSIEDAKASAQVDDEGNSPEPEEVTPEKVISSLKAKFEAYKAIGGGQPSPQQAMPPQTGGAPFGGDPNSMFTQDQVDRAMKNAPRISAETGLPVTPAAPPPPPEPQWQPGEWTPERLHDSLSQINPDYQRTTPPELLARITPEAVAAAESAGAQDPVRTVAFIESLKMQQEQEASQVAAGKAKAAEGNVAKLDPARQAMANSMLKRPASREEYENEIKPLEWFIAPDGSVRQKPEKPAMTTGGGF
jgi:hypothetical protein